MNPHERIAHKILSLARLPVPTLPHIAFLLLKFNTHSRQLVLYQKLSAMSTLFRKFFYFFSRYFTRSTSIIFYVHSLAFMIYYVRNRKGVCIFRHPNGRMCCYAITLKVKAAPVSRIFPHLLFFSMKTAGTTLSRIFP